MTNTTSAVEEMLHKMVKHLLVDKDAGWHEDDYNEYFDEEGSIYVMNSMNDPKPEYYEDIIKKTAQQLESTVREEEREKVSKWFSDDVNSGFIPKCAWCGKIATKQTVKGKHAQENNHRPCNWGYYCKSCYKKGEEIEKEAMYG